MDRRTVLAGMGAAVMAGVSTARADMDMKGMDMKKMGMGHHHHHMGPDRKSLIEASANCVTKGEVCMNHCLMLWADGDTTLAACARSVNEMLAVCRALDSLAVQDAPALPKMAMLAADTCKACEDECKKHAEKHQACKDCMDACAAVSKECKKISA
jgi:Cys-rich four helix bundle protein (predicted Tat secretion target)